MPAGCSVYGCRNRHTKGVDIKFFSFPNDKTICAEWITACGRSDKINITNSRICSVHFPEHCWTIRDVLMNIPFLKRKLKEGSVPSLFLPKSKCVEANTARDKRMQIKHNRELVAGLLKDSFFQTPVTDIRPDYALSLNEFENFESVVAMQKELTELRRTVRRQEVCIESLRFASANLRSIFTEGQIKKLSRPHGHRINWTSRDISAAISQYSAGPRAYRYLLERNYPLPALSTLRAWSQRINKNKVNKRRNAEHMAAENGL